MPKENTGNQNWKSILDAIKSHAAPEISPSEQEQQEEEALQEQFKHYAQQATDAFVACIPRAASLGLLTPEHQLSGDYTDDHGRHVEVRLVQSRRNPNTFTLNANTGDVMALEQLSRSMADHGVFVEHLVSHKMTHDQVNYLLDVVNQNKVLVRMAEVKKNE